MPNDVSSGPSLDVGKSKSRFNAFFNQTLSNSSAINALPGAIGSGIGFAQDVQGEIDYYSNMGFTSPDIMQGGIPQYGGVSDLRSQMASIDPSQAGKGLIGKGLVSGMKLGGTIGMFGGPVGAGIGAAVGGLAGILGGFFGKKKAASEAEEAQVAGREAFEQGQGRYNEAVDQYFTGVGAQRQDIQGDRNYMNRVLGTTNRSNPFASII